jgi:hypothetical protein
MYYVEDIYHPTHDDGVVENTNKKSKTTVNMYLDNADKYECKIPSTVGGKKRYVKCYRSSNKIRNAISGVLYNNNVGSWEEDLYFKVKIPSFEGIFFYDSPQDFERHMFVTLSTAIKEKWHEKETIARKRVAINNA